MVATKSLPILLNANWKAISTNPELEPIPTFDEPDPEPIPGSEPSQEPDPEPSPEPTPAPDPKPDLVPELDPIPAPS